MAEKIEPIDVQRAFWNDWNAAWREKSLDFRSVEQADVVVSWLERLGRKDLSILDVGCGTGWLCPQLTRFGQVTGTDLADEILTRAAAKVPEVRFVSGDFNRLEFGGVEFDVVVSLEVLSHVADQTLFLDKISTLLKPGGYLMIATQNRPVLEANATAPPSPGQRRHWVDRHELRQLLDPDFEIVELFSISPRFNRGFLRAVNSFKLRALADAAGLGAVMAQVRKWQEQAWLGWSLMALARKRVT